MAQNPMDSSIDKNYKCKNIVNENVLLTWNAVNLNVMSVWHIGNDKDIIQYIAEDVYAASWSNNTQGLISSSRKEASITKKT